MALVLYNTETQSKEVFEPLNDNIVTMYNCGPTVYNYAHIGNLRSYVFADILRRTLEIADYTVTQVINITDVGHLASDSDTGEDKMTKGLRREGRELSLDAMRELADRYAKAFIEDIALLNITKPEYLPKASEHIAEDIALISALEKNGYVYQITDGLYFNTEKFAEYGKLGGLTKNGEAQRARITHNTEKKNERDFALWKFNQTIGWESPWGMGFPGWHIECSGMSMKYLGETIDIHTGGIDHISTHHNNEIAQSEGATGKQFVRYWLHGAFLTIAGERIAKSKGNSLYLHDLMKKGYHPLAYRYFLLQGHYRTPLTFSWEALDAAQRSLERLIRSSLHESQYPKKSTRTQEIITSFCNALYNDLDTPQALRTLHMVIDDETISMQDRSEMVTYLGNMLGFPLHELAREQHNISNEAQALFDKRQQAKSAQQWDKADRIREDLISMGYEVHDATDGGQLLKTLRASALELRAAQQRT